MSRFRQKVLIRKKYTVKPVNKGHPRKRLNIIFIDKWSLFGGNFVLFYQGMVLKCGLY